jgi:hypothetical protein
MSAKSRQGKKVHLGPAKARTPRELDVINKDYAQLVSQLGQTEYQAFVLKEETNRLNALIRDLNYEAAERNKINQVKAESSQPEQTEGQ